MSGDRSEWPPSRVGVGDWIIFFDAAVEVIKVRDSEIFRARHLLLRTMGAHLVTTLIPVDYEPIPITWAVTASNAGPAPRRATSGRTG